MKKLGDQYTILSRELTKDKILSESARLFALNNYDAVTMIDIANAVGIKSGSLYSHYLSKEEILSSIYQKYEKHYKEFFARLSRANENAVSSEEIINNMFTETNEVVDLFPYYVMAILLKEQFRSEKAYEITRDLLFKYSINQIKGYYDDMAAKGLTAPIDSEFMASLIMLNLFSINHMIMQEQMGRELPIKSRQINKLFSELLIKLTKEGSV